MKALFGRFEILSYWALAVMVAALWLWPAEFWMDVRSVEVTDAPPGESLIILDREVHRDFEGRYTVTLRDTAQRVVCTASEGLSYQEGAAVPDAISLDWWTNGKCSVLEPGAYTMTTAWTINPARTPFAKTVTVVSRPFHVSDPAPELKQQALSGEVESLQLQIDDLVKIIEVTK